MRIKQRYEGEEIANGSEGQGGRGVVEVGEKEEAVKARSPRGGVRAPRGASGEGRVWSHECHYAHVRSAPSTGLRLAPLPLATNLDRSLQPPPPTSGSVRRCGLCKLHPIRLKCTANNRSFNGERSGGCARGFP